MKAQPTEERQPKHLDPAVCLASTLSRSRDDGSALLPLWGMSLRRGPCEPSSLRIPSYSLLPGDSPPERKYTQFIISTIDIFGVLITKQ